MTAQSLQEGVEALLRAGLLVTDFVRIAVKNDRLIETVRVGVRETGNKTSRSAENLIQKYLSSAKCPPGEWWNPAYLDKAGDRKICLIEREGLGTIGQSQWMKVMASTRATPASSAMGALEEAVERLNSKLAMETVVTKSDMEETRTSTDVGEELAIALAHLRMAVNKCKQGQAEDAAYYAYQAGIHEERAKRVRQNPLVAHGTRLGGNPPTLDAVRLCTQIADLDRRPGPKLNPREVAGALGFPIEKGAKGEVVTVFGKKQMSFVAFGKAVRRCRKKK